MKKSINMTLYVDEGDFSDLLPLLDTLKGAAKDMTEDLKSEISYHDCYHDEGKPCKDKTVVL